MSTVSDATARGYSKRLRNDVTQVLELAGSITECIDVGDPNLRRSFRLEALALACYWIRSFSAATEEMHLWADFFCKQLVDASEVKEAYRAIGAAGDAEHFVSNRAEYYEANGVTWNFDESILYAWMGMLNLCALFELLKVPPMTDKRQNVEHLVSFEGDSRERLKEIYGVDSQSDEFLELIGVWLRRFVERLAPIVSVSSTAFVVAVASAKQVDSKLHKAAMVCVVSLLAASLWSVVLALADFHDIWIYQISRIGVTLAAVFGALSLPLRYSIALCVVAVLYNPLLPIEFDEGAWRIVNWLAAACLGFVGLRAASVLRRGSQPNAQQNASGDGDKRSN